jgi:hypothetical protein
MEGESTTQASTPAGAVFLSYASQDAEAAARICDALRVGGIEVWFDQSELRGGDAWDQKTPMIGPRGTSGSNGSSPSIART